MSTQGPSDPSTSKSTIRWLHLSDFHTGRDLQGQRKSFETLIEYVKNKNLRPDIVFMTGDIANHGNANEYKLFFDYFFSPLVDALEESIPARIFLIPGNHDVNREKAKLSLGGRDSIFKDFPRTLDASGEGRQLREHICERFSNYREADLHAFTCIDYDWIDSDNGSYFHEISYAGCNVGILGLNTAWFSRDDSDRQNLSPGLDIVSTGMKNFKDCDIRFVAGHHAIDWYSDSEREPIRSHFGQNHVIYLHGDQHRNWVREETAAGGKFLVMQTGATFQERDDELLKNRFIWCELDIAKKRIQVHPLLWSRDQQQWRPDGDALPEEYDENGLELPGPREKVAHTIHVTPASPVNAVQNASASLPETTPGNYNSMVGWEIFQKGDLEKRFKTDLEDDEALRYFEGSVPDWPEALAREIIPRRDMVGVLRKRVDEAREKALCVTLLVGGGGEGKSTILRQVVCDLLASTEANAGWRVVWHDEENTPLPVESLIRLPKSQDMWLVVSDEADWVANDVFEAVKALRRQRRRDVHFLLCCRDTDWQGVGGDKYTWNLQGADFVKLDLSYFSRSESEKVIDAWRKYGDKGLGKLKDLSRDQAIDRLLSLAKSESSRDSSLLGAMIQARIGTGIKEHISALLDRLSSRLAVGDITLQMAYIYVAALHAENFLILTRDVLSRTFGCSNNDIDRYVIAPLGREAAISTRPLGNEVVIAPSSKYIFTRHRAIAEAALDIFTAAHHGNLNDIYVELFESAIRIFNEDGQNPRRRVPEIRNWRRLPTHFFDKGLRLAWDAQKDGKQASADKKMEQADEWKDLAIRLVYTAIKVEENDPLHRTQLARFYQQDGQLRRGVEILREAFYELPGRAKDNQFYHQWATAEGKLDHNGISAWLDGISLSDNIPRAVKRIDSYSESDSFKIALHGMSIDFEILYYREKEFAHREKALAFGRAWEAATQVALDLPSSRETTDTHNSLKRSHSKATKETATGRVSTQEALNRIIEGIRLAWEMREDKDDFPPEVIAGDALHFSKLESILNRMVDNA